MLLSSNTFAADPIIIDGSTGVKPLVEALATGFKQQADAVYIEIGSGLKPKARISALLNHDIDIAMASHGINVEQIAKQGLKIHRFARMAIVIAVDNRVTISNISHQQLCDIYRGKILNWQELGAFDLLIKSLVRPFSEVDAEVLGNQIDCFSEAMIADNIPVINKSGAMARAIANTSGAIGMTTMVRVAQSEGKMKAIAINDVKPDVENLLSGAYPHTRDSFLITHVIPSEQVLRFLSYVRSEQGTETIIANNAVPAD